VETEYLKGEQQHQADLNSALLNQKQKQRSIINQQKQDIKAKALASNHKKQSQLEEELRDLEMREYHF